MKAQKCKLGKALQYVVCRLTPVIAAFGRLRQKNYYKFKGLVPAVDVRKYAILNVFCFLNP